MANTFEPDIDGLQEEIIQSIEYFSQICKIKVKDNNFIRKKINQISGQRVKFRKFAEESIPQSLKMCSYAEDLIVIAECYEDNDVSNEDLLESLRSLLSDSNLNKSKATSLKKQIENVNNSLRRINQEIFEYDGKITKQRESLPKNISKVDEITDGALSIANNSYIMARIGVGIGVVGAAAAPFTAGASLAVTELGCMMAIEGVAVAGISTAVAGGSAITSGILNDQLKNAREEFSQCLQKMYSGLYNINTIISQYESYWVVQINQTEDIIGKLVSGKRMNRVNKLIARGILTRAKSILASSKRFNTTVRKALDRDARMTRY